MLVILLDYKQLIVSVINIPLKYVFFVLSFWCILKAIVILFTWLSTGEYIKSIKIVNTCCLLKIIPNMSFTRFIKASVVCVNVCYQKFKGLGGVSREIKCNNCENKCYHWMLVFLSDVQVRLASVYSLETGLKSSKNKPAQGTRLFGNVV